MPGSRCGEFDPARSTACKVLDFPVHFFSRLLWGDSQLSHVSFGKGLCLFFLLYSPGWLIREAYVYMCVFVLFFCMWYLLILKWVCEGRLIWFS